MSFNQSKSDKSDAVHRKSGRSASFNQQRGPSGGAYVKAGGGAAVPSPSLSSTRSFNKKSNNNAQGGQARVNPTPVNSAESNYASAARAIPNDTNVQPQYHGGSDVPVANANAKSSESSAAQRSTRVVPKAPASQPPPVSSDSAAPTTPAKGGASKAFQFGSISPGFMNAMAIPARMSSAPPNLDEQKRDQARHDFSRTAPPVPTPVPKQQPANKDTGVADLSKAGDTHTETRAKKDPLVSPLPPASQMQKPSVIPLTGISMAMPYHQSQAPVHFGAPNRQIQSQGMSTASLQMPSSMPLPIGRASQVQHQVFVPSLQPYFIHPQGIMHQGQNMGFTPQMGHQLPHQLGNKGMGINPLFSPQQEGKFAGPRKTTPVKIIHPDTHEELRLHKRADSYSDGGLSGARSHSVMPSQSPPVQPFAAAHPVGYYPSSSYSTSSLFYLTPSSLPLSSKVKTKSKGKKKRKEILQKVHSAGSTSDLYNAYKGPEENKEAVVSSENTVSVSTSGNLKQLPMDAAWTDAIVNEQCGQKKTELDNWEDAADMSTPKLEVSDKTQQVGDGSKVTAKKYSRDFLLKFAGQCTDLPEGFKIMAGIAEALMSSNISSHVIEHDSHPSTGRITDWSFTKKKKKKRIKDRSGGMSQMDCRGSGVIEEDKWNKVSNSFHSGMLLDGSGGNTGFRPGQGSNFGILIPSPNQSPLQIMHKAEKKYEVGKVADEEQAKQRQSKGILNKLTPQNFEKLFEQVKAVSIDNAVTLTGVISQIFEKALMEPTFCEMYANFCFHLEAALPDLSQDNEKITFKRLLLNKCQEEFERGEREQEEANKADEGEVKQTDEEREEKRTKARRRMLGNIRLIGELYKKRMLTERIMHECIKKLLGQYQDPYEEDVEALCKLMSTIGEMIDHPKAKEHMDVYFERMRSLSNNMNLSSRVRFMLKDAIDLRENKWQQRRKVEGPKKIEEVHRDTSQERQAQAGRLGRGPGNIGARRVPIPLPQRPLGDDSVTLGPQGGLAKGMSIIGLPAVSSSTGINGYSNLPDRASYSSREDPTPRYVSDRFAGPTAYDQSSVQEHNMNYGNKDLRNSDRILDSPVVTSPPARAQGTAGSQNTSSEGGWSEEKLQNLSMAAIREYYRQCYMENENEAVGDDMVEIIATKKDIWPQNVESHFIALLEEEVKKGNGQTTTPTKAAWKHIKKDLKTKFGKKYTMKQFKNKYNQLRGKWIDFTNLIKMETGLGYNSGMGQIIASDDEWKKLCEKCKLAKQFEKKGCFHYDKLCIIFGDTTASSANQHPSTKSPSISNDDSEGEKTMKKMSTNQVVGSSSNATGEVDGQDNESNNKLMTCLSILDKIEGIGAAPFTKAVKMLKEDSLWRDIFLALSDERKKDIVLNL